MRFAFVSEELPPSTTSPGQAAMIHRLLAPIDPAEYCLVSRVDYNSDRYRDSPNRLPATYHRLTGGGQPPRTDDGHRDGGEGMRAVPRRLVDLVRRAQELASIVRRERSEAIVACPDRVGDIPTAYLASRLAGARFFPYYFDYYSAWFNSGPSGLVARRLEPFLLARAAGIIVPNEGLRETLERIGGVKATVIHNACDLSLYHGPAPATVDLGRSELQVVFTGAIYDAHYDGFRALLGALARRSDGASLHVHTPTPRSMLVDTGLDGRLVFHGYTPPAAIPDVQRKAGVLFLPLAFHSPFPEVIRTSAPAKLGEYLAAARPILVHAPAESFVSQYFRRYDCGLVVSEQSPAALADALERLCDDATLRERLCANAWKRACEDFDLQRARAAFARFLDVPLRDS
jgi:glycosyltransferase involved in cell wall biosynthesis